MASSHILIPPYAGNRLETRSRADASFRFSGGLEEITGKSVFGSLIDSLHDLIHPPKLAPLKLSSVPIAVPDRMAATRVCISASAAG